MLCKGEYKCEGHNPATFAYRTEISIWPFALAMFVSMLLTLIRVTIRSYKVANTVDALKYE